MVLKRRGSCWGALLIIALGAACSDGDSPKKSPGDPCLGNTDCADTICHDGICASATPKGLGSSCHGDFECDSWRCEGGVCVAGLRPAGEACLSAAECASGRCTSGLCGGAPPADGGADLPPRDLSPADGPARDQGLQADGLGPKADGGPDTSSADLAPTPDAAACSGPCVSTIAGIGQIGFVDGPPKVATLNNPKAIALDEPNQRLFVLDVSGNGAKVRRIDLTSGVVSTLVGTPAPAAPAAGAQDGAAAQASFKSPDGLCFRGGKLYVADTGNYLLRAVDPTSGNVSRVAGTVGQSGNSDGAALTVARIKPSSCAIDSTGKVWLADYYGIRSYDPSSKTITTVNTTSKHIGLIQHLTLLDDDTAVYPVFHKLFRLKLSTGIESDLSVLTAAGHHDGALTAALFNYPQGLGLHGSGATAAIMVADRQNAVLRRVDLSNNMVSTPAGIVGQTTPKALDGIATQSTFNWPVDVAIASNGDVYIVDAYNHRIRRYRP